jgi:hypothetical protein
MFTFNNNAISGSYSMRPKKEKNPVEYININNDNFNDNNKILNFDLGIINFDNIAVELALNILQLKYNKYNEMTQQDMIVFYNEKIKLNNNINSILALKIILKYKFKGLDVGINKLNRITINDDILNNNQLNSKNTQNITVNSSQIKPKPDSNIINNSSKHKEFSIIQNGKKMNSNDFKIIQIEIGNEKKNYTNNIYNLHVPNKNINRTSFNNDYLDIISYNDKLYNNSLNNQNNYQNFNLNYYPKSYPNSNSNFYPNTNTNTNTNTNLNTQPYINPLPYPHTNLNHNQNETFNGQKITKSSEFDIDSIINLYKQKKTVGMIK